MSKHSDPLAGRRVVTGVVAWLLLGVAWWQVLVRDPRTWLYELAVPVVSFLARIVFWGLWRLTGPNAWGMVVATACLVQLAFGFRLDRRYDRSVGKSFWIAPLYPLGYRLLMPTVTVRGARSTR